MTKEQSLLVFVSYTWDQIAYRDYLDSILKVADFKPVVDENFIKYGESIDNRIEAQIPDCDAFVGIFSRPAYEKRYVSEEIVRAHTLGIPIFLMVEEGSEDLLPPSISNDRYESFSEDKFPSSVVKLVVAIQKELPHIRAQASLRQYRCALAEANKFLGRTNVTRASWERNVALADRIGSRFHDELKTIDSNNYAVNIGEQSQFVERANPTFHYASRIHAVSLDSVSRFWGNDAGAELERGYLEAQKTTSGDTHRLFVISGPKTLDRYSTMLNQHYEQYGKDGGIYVCSPTTYKNLCGFVQLKERLDQDYAALTYENKEVSETQVALLDRAWFRIERGNNRLANSENIDQLFSVLGDKTELGLTTDVAGKGYVLRWQAGIIEEKEAWRENLVKLFGSTDSCMHAISFRKALVEQAGFDDLIAKIRALSAEDLREEFEVESFYVGQTNLVTVADPATLAAIGVKRADEFPFVVVLTFATNERLEAWYLSRSVAKLREEFYKLIPDHDMHQLYEKLRSCEDPIKKQQIGTEIESIGSKYLHRYNWVPR